MTRLAAHWPRRCIYCGRIHLNGRRVSLPLCISCALRERDRSR